jgi:moderate conductance mechanosensitive channel
MPLLSSSHNRTVRPLRLLRYGLLSLGVSLCILCIPTVSLGQVGPGSAASPSASPTANPIQVIPSPLRSWQDNLPSFGDLLSSAAADVTRQSIWLDGRRLFSIAVPAIGDNASATAANETRRQTIEDRLQQLVEDGFDPETLAITAETDPSSRQPVIYAEFVRNGETQRQQLLTVTALDAEVNGSNLQDWATEISVIVEEALLTAQAERQPDFLRQQGILGAIILLVTGLFSLLLYRHKLYLRRKYHTLKEQTQVETAELADPATASPETTTQLLQQRAADAQKKRLNDIQWRLAQLSQLLLWGVATYAIVGLFPHSRWLQPLMAQWVQIPVRLLLIVLFTYLAIRLSEMLIDRLFWALQSSTSLATDTSQRLLLRFTTFSRVTKSIAVLVWGTIGLLTAIAMLGIQVNPALLTLAGIIGVGISLASQNVIKDIINGFLILLEDQYGVGDVVTIGQVSGFVENMNLRITQLRSTEGHLITIPNSAISVVENLSKEWSRVDLRINVAYESNLDEALAVTEQVAQVMSRDPAWRDLILEAPQVLGVDNLDYAGATIRLWIKTQPLKQWEVAREYRRRLKLAFDQAGIAIGIPQQSLLFSNSAETPESESSLSATAKKPGRN